MSEPFVTQLRARRESLSIGNPGSNGMTVRVEVPEVWDTVAVHAPTDASVRLLKRAALEALVPGADIARWVMKLRGFEVLDEDLPLTGAGASDGSIFLLTSRRRRPVR